MIYFAGLQVICTLVNVIIYVDDRANRGGVLSKVDRDEPNVDENEEIQSIIKANEM